MFLTFRLYFVKIQTKTMENCRANVAHWYWHHLAIPTKLHDNECSSAANENIDDRQREFSANKTFSQCGAWFETVSNAQIRNLSTFS